MKRKIILNNKLNLIYHCFKKRIKTMNISYGFLFVLLVIGGLWLLHHFNGGQLFFIGLIVCFCIYLKIALLEIIIILLLSFLLSFGIWNLNIAGKENIFGWLFSKNIFHNGALDIVNKNYTKPTNIFLEMLILNKIDYKNSTFLLFRNLNILHLVVISGLHFQAIKGVISKVFFFNKKLGTCFAFFLLTIYWSMINFSYPLFRVLLTFWIKNKGEKNFFTQGTKIALMSLLYNPKIYLSYSFILSMGIILILDIVLFLKLKSKILEGLLINFFIGIFTTLIFLPINHKFFYFTILNNFIFSFIVIFLYVILFFSGFFIYLKFFIIWLSNIFLDTIDLFYFNKMYYYLLEGNSNYSQIIMAFILHCVFFIYFGLENRNN